MRTAVITDSNSGITSGEAERYQIRVVPMPVIIDGTVYYEGKDLTEEAFYQALKGGRDVSTSQPSPGEVMELWDDALASGYDEIVYIPMSSGLSESCNTAKGLAAGYDGKVHVVDNHRISLTHKASVLDAVRLVEKGVGAEEIQRLLEDSAYDASIYVAVDTLEFLRKGGRVTAAGAALGSMLHIKPVLSIQGDKLDAYAKVRGMKKCQAKMIDALRGDESGRFAGHGWTMRVITAGSALSQEQAEEWRSTVAAAFPGYEVEYSQLSLSIGCHVGPGAMGLGICRILE